MEDAVVLLEAEDLATQPAGAPPHRDLLVGRPVLLPHYRHSNRIRRSARTNAMRARGSRRSDAGAASRLPGGHWVMPTFSAGAHQRSRRGPCRSLTLARGIARTVAHALRSPPRCDPSCKDGSSRRRHPARDVRPCALQFTRQDGVEPLKVAFDLALVLFQPSEFGAKPPDLLPQRVG